MEVLAGFLQVHHACGGMMFVPTPETPSWVPFPEPRMCLEHFLSAMGLEHNLCIFDRVPFWDIHLEVYMVPGETKVAELEPKAFQVMERFSAGVNVGLFPETVISFLGDEHHCHPVIAGVNRNLFRASATFIYQNFHASCRTFVGHTSCGVSHATKKRLVNWLKNGATFHLRVLRYRFRPRSIPSRNYKLLNLQKLYILLHHKKE